MGEGEGSRDRCATVHDDMRFMLHSTLDLLHDIYGVFVVWILVGEDNLSTEFFCDPAHDWAFP